MARTTSTASKPWETPSGGGTPSSSRFFSPSIDVHKYSNSNSNSNTNTNTNSVSKRMTYRSWEDKTPEPKQVQSPPFERSTISMDSLRSTLLQHEHKIGQLQKESDKIRSRGIHSGGISSSRSATDGVKTTTTTAASSSSSSRTWSRPTTIDTSKTTSFSHTASKKLGKTTTSPRYTTASGSPLSTSELEALSPRYAAVRAKRFSPENKSRRRSKSRSPRGLLRTRFSPDSRNTEISAVTSFTPRSTETLDRSSPGVLSFSSPYGKDLASKDAWKTKSVDETFSPSTRRSPYFSRSPQTAAAAAAVKRDRLLETGVYRTKSDSKLGKLPTGSDYKKTSSHREWSSSSSSSRTKYTARSPTARGDTMSRLPPISTTNGGGSALEERLPSPSSLSLTPSTKIDADLLRAKHHSGGPTRGEQFVVELCELLELDVGHHVFLANVMDEQVFNSSV